MPYRVWEDVRTYKYENVQYKEENAAKRRVCVCAIVSTHTSAQKPRRPPDNKQQTKQNSAVAVVVVTSHNLMSDTWPCLPSRGHLRLCDRQTDIAAGSQDLLGSADRRPLVKRCQIILRGDCAIRLVSKQFNLFTFVFSAAGDSGDRPVGRWRAAEGRIKSPVSLCNLR